MPNKSVVIIQEYVPEYRRGFFELLGEALKPDEIELTVVVGDTPPDALARRDSVVSGRIVGVPTRFVSVGQRYVGWRRAGDATKGTDLVIADQQLRQLETHSMLLRQHFGGVPTALWGHGGSYSGQPNKVDQWLMRRMTNQAHWFFAYTQRGADAVVSGGFPADRVTAVGNASETEDVMAWRADVTGRDIETTRERLGLGGGPVGIYIGALDESKGIGLLLEAGAEIVRSEPDFKLVICGDGPMRSSVEERADAAPWLHYLGRSTGREKVGVAACAQVLLIPARIGLVAVDSLALGIPILTTTDTGHGPEFDFLEPNKTVAIVPGGAPEYASAVIDLLRDAERLASMSKQCLAAATHHTVGEMVVAFRAGIGEALAAAAR